VSWTREQAVKDVIEASDGFGRVCEASPVQTAVLELARTMRRLLERSYIVPRNLLVSPENIPLSRLLKRCERPGCVGIFKWKPRKRFCSMRCSVRESRRASKKRKREATKTERKAELDGYASARKPR
jgi:hypothetical protein